ncbi:uncharacterized protein BDW70DRAFT_33599 [Aspergillus foveolatus]|uniref:uncharacterized protein n=1 Tax=Aspergillus foveolatus TaxID=210207 RepID=UPI003CCE2506
MIHLSAPLSESFSAGARSKVLNPADWTLESHVVSHQKVTMSELYLESAIGARRGSPAAMRASKSQISVSSKRATSSQVTKSRNLCRCYKGNNALSVLRSCSRFSKEVGTDKLSIPYDFGPRLDQSLQTQQTAFMTGTLHAHCMKSQPWTRITKDEKERPLSFTGTNLHAQRVVTRKQVSAGAQKQSMKGHRSKPPGQAVDYDLQRLSGSYLAPELASIARRNSMLRL